MVMMSVQDSRKSMVLILKFFLLLVLRLHMWLPAWESSDAKIRWLSSGPHDSVTGWCQCFESSFIPLSRIQHVATCLHSKLIPLCPTLYDAMQWSPPGSSVCLILQARILEWLPYPPPRDLPNRGSNLCLLSLLRWQAGSLPCGYLGS